MAAPRTMNIGSPRLTDDLVVQAIRGFRAEADQARRTRMKRNKANMAAYMGIQDWSGKQKGQSREFIPKTPVAVEQFSAFVKRALMQTGDDWYTAQLAEDSQSPLTPEQIRALLNCFLRELPVGHKTTSFPLVLADAVKVGLLEALPILKVHGRVHDERIFVAERGRPIFNAATGQTERPEPELKQIEFPRWRLQIDVVDPNTYFPDPSGRNLYEIHEVERDLHEVVEAAEAGLYDREMVARIEEDYRLAHEDRRRAVLRGQDEETAPSFRKRVRICEFWGTLLDASGKVIEKNVVSALANDRYVIRKPEPNPYWHQESPFVAEPIIRVPFSVWHKALYDHGTPLNIALNEVFNLMIDGGIASVWGIKQVRIDALADPRQISGGIPQGETLIVNNTLPVGGKVLETVTEGEVPAAAMAMFEALVREFNSAALTNEVRMGALPSKQVKATEVVEASQSNDVTLDSIASDLEQGIIEKTLRKAFLTLLQAADDLDSQQVVNAIGARAALKLSRMAPAERYAALARSAGFRVSGLSSTLARVRDFQKIMAAMQAVQINPLLFQAFMRRFSADKALTTIFKSLNINPSSIELDEQETAEMPARMAELPMIAQMLNPRRSGSGGTGPSAEETGDASLPAEINQQVNPMTGMV